MMLIAQVTGKRAVCALAGIALLFGAGRAASQATSHGASHVAVSPDSRYAFVSSEGVGAAPGKVDIYDLKALARVGSADVGQQAGGIAFWKMEPAGR
ncbi:MAG: hypothetical protein WKG32_06340 [Gemmatimonadaceae bacterium]